MSALSVLSYNIQAGIGTQAAHHYITRAHQQLLSTKAKTRRLKAIGKFVGGFDVVCLQEVDLGGRRAGFENQVEIITSTSKHTHSVFQENRVVRRISRHGNAILTRVPVLSCDDVKLPGKVGGRGALIVELEMEPQTVVVNAHLSLGVADQTAQLLHIAGALDTPKWKRARVVVCGDMNCGPNAPPIEAFCEATGLHALTAPHHKTYPSWSPRQALDHILAWEAVRKYDVRVEDADFSDHRAVSARFPRGAHKAR